MLLFVPMVASGYLLQTTVTEGWRTTWIVVHLASSTLWIVTTIAHLVRHALYDWLVGQMATHGYISGNDLDYLELVDSVEEATGRLLAAVAEASTEKAD